MNSRYVIASLGLTLFLFTPGCRSDKAAQLVGSWKLDAGFASGTTTFSKDGTYIQTVTGLTSGSEKGAWRIEGDKLIMKAETSTVDRASVGKELPSTIVKLEDAVLILEIRDKNGQTSAVTLQRVR